MDATLNAGARAQELIQSLGRKAGIADLDFDDEGLLVFDIDGSQSLALGFEAEREAISLYAPIRGSDGKRREGLLESLLAANFMWQETQGATLALDKATDHIVLHQRLPLAKLTSEDFEASLETFFNTVQAFSQLAVAAPQADEPGQAPLPNDAMFGAMRV